MEDIELWLYEVEGHLASDDYGKDLTSVQNLQKKHALLEADVAAHQVGAPRPAPPPLPADALPSPLPGPHRRHHHPGSPVPGGRPLRR